MKRRLHILLICFFLGFHSMTFATHIVGGTLTYVYNGGSSYTVTLKLFRDCTGLNFNNLATVTVLGANGTAFSPSKDIVLTLGSITSVPSGLPPCSTAPTPMPCTEEGIYTATV